MYDNKLVETSLIKVGFRVNPQLNNDFNLLAAQLNMTINEAHVEAVTQFLITKGSKIIKRNIELERKKLDILESIISQYDENDRTMPISNQKHLVPAGTANGSIKREIDNYVLRIDRSFTSRHIIEFASMISNKNNMLLKETLGILRESVFELFPGDTHPTRRLVLIENAIKETEGV